MGGKYERDDLATLRVTNVSLWLVPRLSLNTDSFLRRSQRWQRNRICGRCLSGSDGSREFSLRRTEIQGEPRDLLSFPLSTELMQLVLVRKWTALGIDISFFGSSLQRGLPRYTTKPYGSRPSPWEHRNESTMRLMSEERRSPKSALSVAYLIVYLLCKPGRCHIFSPYTVALQREAMI